MTDKDLKKLSKAELLEILWELRKELDEAHEENASLRLELTQLKRDNQGEMMKLLHDMSGKIDVFCDWLVKGDGEE